MSPRRAGVPGPRECVRGRRRVRPVLPRADVDGLLQVENRATPSVTPGFPVMEYMEGQPLAQRLNSTPQTVQCPRCGITAQGMAEFCSRCGLPLSATGVAPSAVASDDDGRRSGAGMATRDGSPSSDALTVLRPSTPRSGAERTDVVTGVPG